MRIEPATAADLPAVEALLTASGLPLDGAPAAFTRGVIARDGDRLIGCAAVEAYDGAALLRSVAVAADQRGSGVGTGLVHAAEDVARAVGATTLILLTETAEDWFRGLGYEAIDRAAVPSDVADSIEFTTACSTAAVALRRMLA